MSDEDRAAAARRVARGVAGMCSEYFAGRVTCANSETGVRCPPCTLRDRVADALLAFPGGERNDFDALLKACEDGDPEARKQFLDIALAGGDAEPAACPPCLGCGGPTTHYGDFVNHEYECGACGEYTLRIKRLAGPVAGDAGALREAWESIRTEIEALQPPPGCAPDITFGFKKAQSQALWFTNLTMRAALAPGGRPEVPRG